MGKRDIRTVHVPKAVTFALLVIVSAAMAGIIYGLSGRAYAGKRSSVAEVIATVAQHAGDEPVVLASLAPVIADILFFIPWGVLAFLAIDRAERPRVQAYAATVAVGVAFALGLMAWQRVLPTHVTSWIDVVWNAVGCFVGAIAGHARKRMFVRFE